MNKNDTFFRDHLSTYGKCQGNLSKSFAVILMNYYENETSNLDLGMISEIGRIVGKKICMSLKVLRYFLILKMCEL